MAGDPTTSEIYAQVRALLDREEIRDLASRYVDCVWRQDIDGVVDLFADDATLVTEEFPPVTGRAALLEAYKMVFDSQELEPWVHNHVIQLDGDTATGRCYLDLRLIRDGRRLLATGVYDDVYVKVDGAWKFCSRTVAMRSFWPAWRRPRPTESSVDGEGED